VSERGVREFFSLKQIADAARAEKWPTGRALEESRKLLARRRRVTRNRQAKADSG
jgi:hypothetical protein